MVENGPPEPVMPNREKRKEENFEKIMNQLSHDHIPYRVKAVEALGRIGDERAVEPLLPLLNDPSPDVQWVTAQALGKLHDRRAVEPLIEALLNSDHWIRKGAAWALGEIEDDRAVPALVPLLRDRKKDVRIAAAEALGRILDQRGESPETSEVIGILLEMQEDDEPEVRTTARVAFRKITEKDEDDR
jgi:HEAT repeat protein